ncbi:MAG: LysR family transcriptional regulator [Clostridiales bacterium]|jgi:DNA-binding transcriptional LysR family regulator|nr:LysR family transcriptional regulator [Clostridiales bacterium]
MYNRQLDTFIRVADAGSFSKAAENNFITPTAVIKQINRLEKELGLRLFVRTYRGIALTEEGKLLYDDAKYVIQYCEDSVRRAKGVGKHSEDIIRIGVSPMTPGEFLLGLWPKIHELCPNIKFRLVTFDNTPENAWNILHNLGQGIDVVAGWFDNSYEHVFGCAALKLKDDPICCAVSVHHKLSSKNLITVDDLRGESLMLVRGNWEFYIGELRDFTLKQGVNIIDFDFYDVSVFNRCENSDLCLMAFDSWKNAHPLMKILPVEWKFTVPYGLLYSHTPSKIVERLIDAVRFVVEL